MNMEEAIEDILKYAQKKIQYFEDPDKYAILKEAAHRMQLEGQKAMRREYDRYINETNKEDE